MLHQRPLGDAMRTYLIWAGAVVLTLTGCGNGSRILADEAESHFRTHQVGYDQIVALVDECRPARTGSSYRRVWADGSSNEGLRCFRGTSDVGTLEQALKETGAVAVHYMTNDGPEAHSPGGFLNSVEITVFSSGIATSGTSIDFVYSPVTMTKAPPDYREGDYTITRRLVGTPPYHWYWEQGSN